MGQETSAQRLHRWNIEFAVELAYYVLLITALTGLAMGVFEGRWWAVVILPLIVSAAAGVVIGGMSAIWWTKNRLVAWAAPRIERVWPAKGDEHE